MAEAIFEAIKRAPAYKVVEQNIRKSVLDGTLSPGDMLPGETELAEPVGLVSLLCWGRFVATANQETGSR